MNESLSLRWKVADLISEALEALEKARALAATSGLAEIRHAGHDIQALIVDAKRCLVALSKPRRRGGRRMNKNARKEVAALVREARTALSRTWKIAHVGTGKDVELERIVVGMILAAQTHLWAVASELRRLCDEGVEVDE